MTKMFADEVDIDAALVRRLLVAQFPQWAELPVEPVEPRGTDNALYRIGDDKVVRLPRRPRTVSTLEKERRWLPRLAPHLPLTVPTPLADGAPGEGFPFVWCVYTWIEGEAPGEHVDARDLAAFLIALQRIDTTGAPGPGEHNFFRGEPVRARDAAVRESIAALRGTLDGDAFTAEWEKALDVPDWDGDPVWIHGDLDARNVLARDGRITAVVDWGSAGVGDPACDVMVAWKLLDAAGRDVFREALAVDDATWARARGWALSQAVMALSYYTNETNAVLVAEARRWLRELDVDAHADRADVA